MAKKKKETVLITGASGFIGYHVARLLSEDGRLTPVCIVRSQGDSHRTEALRQLGAVVVNGSFLHTETLDRILKTHGIRFVVHSAAIRGGGAGSPEDYLRVNVQGTDELLRLSLAHGVHRFIHISSVGVFGTIPKTLPAGRDTPIHGDNLYHSSKVQAEERVRRYANNGLDTCILRPTVTYGSGDNGFPSTLVKLVQARRFLVSTREVLIHLLDVGKLAELIAQILWREDSVGGPLIVADQGPIQISALVDLIHSHFYGVAYPKHLRVPSPAFRAATLFFGLLGREKWSVRSKLISESWYFDLGDTLATIPDFLPALTEQRFIQAVCAGV